MNVEINKSLLNTLGVNQSRTHQKLSNSISAGVIEEKQYYHRVILAATELMRC